MENENNNISQNSGIDESSEKIKNPEGLDLNVPEINLDKVASGQESDTTGGEGSEETATAIPAVPKYSWSYETQLKEERKKGKRESRRGALVYFAIVASVFAVCFAILAAVLAFGYVNGFSTRTEVVYQDRVVYVRQDTDSSGILTVQEIAAKVTPSTVGILVTFENGTGTGTGIVLDTDGHISTDYHVIKDAVTIKVALSDGREFPAEYIGGDELADIAVLKVAPGSFEMIPAEFGDSDQVLVGDSVVAIGNASGMELFGSVTTGVVSGIRNLKIYDSNGLVTKSMKFIQTNAELNPGVSGGPVCDEYGRVIGIVVMKYLYENEIEGVGFAIPSTLAKQAFDEIIATGSYSGGIATKGVSLGIKITEVTEGFGVQIDEAGTIITPGADGVMVVEITSEESSAYGYLKLYDIITAVNGKAVNSASDVRNVLANLVPGDTINLTVLREDKTVNVIIPLK